MNLRKRWPLIAAAVVLIALIVAGVLIVAGGSDKAAAQTVRFQEPTDSGPDPFTKPSDVQGSDRVNVGSGPYGGTGSDLVCDRELLIRSLRARPDRMRAWAKVRSISPNIEAVARYIRSLKPVTLTRDTRVTNYTFANGDAQGFQAILQAGTAVLVDKYGTPVARCRCGNPLTKYIYYPKAECLYCPPHYEPPPPCEPYSECYKPYPHPPPVKTSQHPTPTDTRTSNPSASITPGSGSPEDTYTLTVNGFSPNTKLDIKLTRPDGQGESYSLTTDGSGSGSYTFPHVNNPVTGTYTAVVTDPKTGKSATASATVGESGQNDQSTTQTDQTQTQPEAPPPDTPTTQQDTPPSDGY